MIEIDIRELLLPKHRAVFSALRNLGSALELIGGAWLVG